MTRAIAWRTCGSSSTTRQRAAAGGSCGGWHAAKVTRRGAPQQPMPDAACRPGPRAVTLLTPSRAAPMTRILPARSRARLRHPGSACRPGPRAAGRRGDDPDLPDLHLRPGRAGRAQGLRVRAGPRTRPARRWSGTWPASRAPPTALPSAPASPRSTRVLKLFKTGDHVVCGDNVYGGSQRLMERIYARSRPDVHLRGHAGRRRIRARPHPGHADGLLRDPHQSDDEPRRPRGGGRPGPGPRLPVRGGQHLRHPVLPAAPRVRRRSWCSTRPPST